MSMLNFPNDTKIFPYLLKDLFDLHLLEDESKSPEENRSSKQTQKKTNLHHLNQMIYSSLFD